MIQLDLKKELQDTTTICTLHSVVSRWRCPLQAGSQSNNMAFWTSTHNTLLLQVSIHKITKCETKKQAITNRSEHRESDNFYSAVLQWSFLGIIKRLWGRKGKAFLAWWCSNTALILGYRWQQTALSYAVHGRSNSWHSTERNNKKTFLSTLQLNRHKLWLAWFTDEFVFYYYPILIFYHQQLTKTIATLLFSLRVKF